MAEIIRGSMAVKIRNRGNSGGVSRGGYRKAIYCFSKEARRNLLWRLQSLDVEGLRRDNYSAFFITLTYQVDFFRHYKDNRLVKDDYDVFFTKLRRYFNRRGIDCFAFWKLEFTQKGIPHFHLLLFLDTKFSREELLQVVNAMWVGVIVRNIQEENLDQNMCENIVNMHKAATNTRYSPLELQDVLMKYISKEVGKASQTEIDGYTGRFWGISNRKLYYKYEKKEIEHLELEEFYILRRLMSKMLRKKGYKHKRRGDKGMCLFYVKDMSVVDRLVQCARELAYEKSLGVVFS